MAAQAGGHGTSRRVLALGRAPQRRCVGCGRIADKPELVRFALSAQADGATPAAVLDRDGRMPGRGAYLCRAQRSDGPTQDCLALALRRGGIQRALRARATVDPKLVESVSR
ncbi:MAG: YlxR family protein [Solirubrobacteraceae bacterium]